MIIQREDYKLIFDDPILYINNEKRNRSGHMSHAMTYFQKDTLIDFNSNCSPVRCKGHAAYGWIEYKISKDNAKTFERAHVLPFSKKAFLDGNFTISVENAVATSKGRIVITLLRNTMLSSVCCEPWFAPMTQYSDDGGKTWSQPKVLCQYKGRPYSMVIVNDVIYILHFCNEGNVHFTGNAEEHKYRIYESTDFGETFHEKVTLEGDTKGRGYGALQFDGKAFHAYMYNINDERHMDHYVSLDNCASFQQVGACYVEKGIRNPHMNILDGIWILHGRGEKDKGFVIYSSKDGYLWDEGVYLETEKKWCYYSNNILLKEDGKHSLMIQYSDTYKDSCVNVMHLKLHVENMR